MTPARPLTSDRRSAILSLVFATLMVLSVFSTLPVSRVEASDGPPAVPDSNVFRDDDPDPFESHANTALAWTGSVAYVFGGKKDSTTFYDHVLEFDPAADDASRIIGETFASRRHRMSAVWDSNNQVAYIFGGQTSGGGYVDDIYEFDPAGPSLSIIVNDGLTNPQPEDPDFSRRAGTSAVWDSNNQVAYIFGGEDANGKIDEILRFEPGADDPVTVVQTDGTPPADVVLPSPRSDTRAAMVNGIAHVVGGDDGSNAVNEIVEFDPSGPSVATNKVLTPARIAPAVGTEAGDIFVLGGGDGTNPLRSTDKLTPPIADPNSVVDWHHLDEGIRRASAFATGGQVYVLGGEKAGGITDEIRKFDTGVLDQDPDLVPKDDTNTALPAENDALQATVSGSRATVRHRVQNTHVACQVNQTGCDAGAFRHAVYLTNATQAGGVALTRDNLNTQGTEWVEKNVLDEEDILRVRLDKDDDGLAADSSETRTFKDIKLSGFNSGEIITAVGVADWCEGRYSNASGGVDVDDNDPCGNDEGGGDGERNLAWNQFFLKPAPIALDPSLALPESKDLLNETHASNATRNFWETEVDLTVNNTGPVDLDRHFRVEAKLLDAQGDTVKDFGSDVFQRLTPDGQPDDNETLTFDFSREGRSGFHLMQFKVTYPVDSNGDKLLNAGVHTAVFPMEFLAPDFTGTVDVTPNATGVGGDDVEIASTVRNQGTWAANGTAHGDTFSVLWSRCNRLAHPLDNPGCDPDVGTGWTDFTGADADGNRSTKDLDALEVNGTKTLDFEWFSDQLEPGSWRIRSTVDDGPSRWEAELDEENNDATERVTVSNVTFSPVGDVDRKITNETLGFSEVLGVANGLDEAKTVHVAVRPRVCEPRCVWWSMSDLWHLSFLQPANTGETHALRFGTAQGSYATGEAHGGSATSVLLEASADDPEIEFDTNLTRGWNDQARVQYCIDEAGNDCREHTDDSTDWTISQQGALTNTTVWESQTHTLADVDNGDRFRVRFNFTADGAGDDARGWLVDNVTISAADPVFDGWEVPTDDPGTGAFEGEDFEDLWNLKFTPQGFPARTTVSPGQSGVQFQGDPLQRLDPGDRVNVTLIACEKSSYDVMTTACSGHGDVKDLLVEYAPQWGADIRPIGRPTRSAEPDDTRIFEFDVINVAAEESDCFEIATTDSGPVDSVSLARISPQGPPDDATTDPHGDDGTPPADCNGEDALEPDESNRFRLTVGVASSANAGDQIEVNATALSLRGPDDLGPFTQTFRLDIGADVGGPNISSEPAPLPAAAGVFNSGRIITYSISDRSGIASVTKTVNGQGPDSFPKPYRINTTGRAEGRLTVRIQATDKTGQKTTRTFTYFVDDTEPTFQSVEVFPSTVHAGGAFDVLASLDEPNVGSVEVTVGSQSSVPAPFNSDSGLYEAKNLSAPSQADLYTVSVNATDQAGNSDTVDRDLEVVVPDVRIASEDVVWDPRAPDAGQTVTVDAKVTNPTAAEIQDYAVALDVDGSEFARQTVTLLGNAKTEVTFTWSGDSGRHDVEVTADPDETITDADRSNNVHGFAIDVRSGGLLGLPGPETYIIAAALVITALGWRRWDARNEGDTPD